MSDKEKLELMPGWLMVKPLLPENKTSVGLEIPVDAVEKPPCGIVIEIGGPIERRDEKPADGAAAPNIQPKDKVYFQKWGGLPMKLNGELFMFLRYSDLVSVVKGK